MTLLIDIFGYLSVILHGLTIISQSMALGGVLFLILAARPFESDLAPFGAAIRSGVRLMALWSALALALCEAAVIALQSAVLVGTLDMPWLEALQAEFALAGMIKIAAALILMLSLLPPRDSAPASILLAACLIEVGAATLGTHANARLDNRLPLLLVEALHQTGAALWIGGIPSFVLALSYCPDGLTTRLVGRRFSRMSMAGVAAIAVSGLVMTTLYVGALDGFYGTAYGVMVSTKIVMFLVLLAMGGMNFLLVERLYRDPATPVTG